MTLKECYQELKGDYDEANERFMTESIMERFVLKFPKDGSMAELKAAVEAGDIEGSFKAAHTLKGLAANMAFSNLMLSAAELTEQLRSCSVPADKELLAKVEEAYDLVIATIRKYEGKED